METAHNINQKASHYSTLLVLAGLLVASTGCARAYHAIHYNGIARTLHESPRNYFHSEKTGRIIPKERCYCPVELPCYGYESTCWRRWPEECVRCPVADEVIDGEIHIHQEEITPIDAGADAVFPPTTNLEETESTSPDLSVGDTPDTNGSAQVEKPAPYPVEQVQPAGDYYHFASNPTEVQQDALMSNTLDPITPPNPDVFEMAEVSTQNDDANLKSESPTNNGSEAGTIDAIAQSNDPVLPQQDLMDTLDEPHTELKGWQPASVDETIDSLISDSEADDTVFTEVAMESYDATLPAVESKSFKKSADKVKVNDEGNIEKSDAVETDAAPPKMRTATSRLKRSEIAPKPSRDIETVSYVRREALPNFALPLPIKPRANDSTPTVNQSKEDKAESSDPTRKNTVRFKDSDSSASTIEFK